EGPGFDAFFLAGWLLIQALVIAAFAAHLRLWHGTKTLLKAIAAQPITAAFSAVPRELFSNRLPPRRPRLIHLQHAINAHDAMVARAQPVVREAEGLGAVAESLRDHANAVRALSPTALVIAAANASPESEGAKLIRQALQEFSPRAIPAPADATKDAGLPA